MPNDLSAILSASSDPLAIFTDFDGTLVEIAPSPDAVMVPESLQDRLQALHGALGGALAIISGRTISDIDRFLPGQNLSVTGSHGAESRHEGTLKGPSSDQIADAQAIRAKIETAMGNQDGILIESKPTGVAVHYRAAPDQRERVETTMATALSDFPDFHAIAGKKVVEARPRGADKGQALRSLMQVKPFAGRTPVFIGDDITDEDGFVAAASLGGFGIKIGAGDTKARFRLADITVLYAYFDALTEGQVRHAQRAPATGVDQESTAK